MNTEKELDYITTCVSKAIIKGFEQYQTYANRHNIEEEVYNNHSGGAECLKRMAEIKKLVELMTGECYTLEYSVSSAGQIDYTYVIRLNGTDKIIMDKKDVKFYGFDFYE